MKANELRIGNWVNFHYEIVNPAREISSSDIQAASMCENGHGQLYFSPLPINEEWLLKFGFERKEDFVAGGEERVEVYPFELNGFRILNSEFGDFKHSCADIDIEYVHQLQNLYFALTGEELELKEIA